MTTDSKITGGSSIEFNDEGSRLVNIYFFLETGDNFLFSHFFNNKIFFN